MQKQTLLETSPIERIIDNSNELLLNNTGLSNTIKDNYDSLKIKRKERLSRKIIDEISDLLDFNLSEYGPDTTDYSSFLTDLSIEIFNNLDNEILRKNKQKLIASVKGLHYASKKDLSYHIKNIENISTSIELENMMIETGKIGNEIFKDYYENIINSTLLDSERNSSLKMFFGNQSLSHFDYEDFKKGKFDYYNKIIDRLDSKIKINYAMGFPNSSPIQKITYFVNIISLNELSKNKKIKIDQEKLDIESSDFLKILEYRENMKLLDPILNDLTRDTCSKNCDRGPCGCCEKQHHDNVYPLNETFSALQEFEALKNGWIQAKKRHYDCCDYLNPEGGCKLTLTKPSICISYLCEGIKFSDEIRKKEKGMEFYNSMQNIYKRSISVSGTHILKEMDHAITIGKQLVVY